MAFNPTPEQKEKLRKGKASITYQGKELDVWGTVGTLEHFGLPVTEAAGDLAEAGISRSVSRGGGQRSRWLGDSEGVGFSGSTAEIAFYPSRRGSALPGEPIKLTNLSTGKTWTVNVVGPIGFLIGWFGDNRTGFDMEIRGKTGNLYTAVMQATDPD